MDNDVRLEIAKLLGEPINYQLPVPVEISAIADTDTAEAGEKVWKYTTVDADLDTILVVDTTNGKLITVKRSPLGETEIPFQGLNSKLQYVLVNDVLGNPDVKVLGRKKESITRGMDKRELKLIIDAIEAGTSAYLPSNASIQSRDATSGEDLYDVILAMKHKIEDYGDDFLLLVGSTAKEKIDTYDKDNVATYRYKINLLQVLRDMKIDVMKIFGKVESTDGGGEAVLLNAKHMILIARNSRVASGKPIKFVRRRINADIARLMGADVDNAQRAIVVGGTPVIVDFSGTSSNVLGYSVVGAEWIVFAIPNPKAICTSDCTAIL